MDTFAPTAFSNFFMKKLTLEFEEPAPWQTIGISSQLADYKLVFRINKALKTEFKRFDNFVAGTAKMKGEFSLYVFNDKANRLKIFLLSNKSNGNILIREFRQLDYFFIIDGEPEGRYLKDTVNKLREIPDVLFTQMIDMETVKNYSALTEAFELHVDRQ